MTQRKNESPALSPEMWMRLQRFKTGEDVTFPLTTEQVGEALDDMGINISEPGINRAVKAAGLTVPSFGRNRAWSLAALRALWEFIVNDGTAEPRVRAGSIRVWQQSHTSEFDRKMIPADDFCREWMRYVEEYFGGATYTDANGVLRSVGPWHHVPEGAVMLYERFPRDDKGELLPSRIRLVPAAKVAKFFEPAIEDVTPAAAAKKPAAKKGRK